MKIFLTLMALAAMAMAEEKSVAEYLQEGNDQFTAKMFTEVVKENKDKSVIMSAFSVMTPLAQLGLASEGETHDELLKAIGLPNDNVTKAAFSELNDKLRSVKGIDLKMANKMYLAKDAELSEDFAKISKDVFNSELQNVDFEKSIEAAKDINTWVEDHTNKRIKDLVSPEDLDDTTRAVLVNAIYFKGTWADPFKKDLTKDDDFHVTKDKTVKVPMMARTGNYKYTHSEELKAKLLEIPYEGYEASFLAVLPDEIDGLAALEEKLADPAILNKAVSEMFIHEVHVKLPKFRIETKTDLKDVLTKMGVSRIFNVKSAKLTRLLKGESNLFVSKAIQKAFIEVNEEGAEAAAANEVLILFGSSGYPKKEFYFKVDHPFIFQIKIEDEVVFEGIFQV